MSRIILWNVNGIRAVEKKDFVGWLSSSGADIVCIQETKANPGQLSEALRNPDGYRSFWASAVKPGYSGTALYTKKEPDNVVFMGIDEFDREGRTIAAFFGTTVVISAYFPNSQDAGARLGYKLDYCAAVFALCNKLVEKGFNIVLCGDYNIAHKPIDLANPKSNEKNAGYLPEERAWIVSGVRGQVWPHLAGSEHRARVGGGAGHLPQGAAGHDGRAGGRQAF